MTRFKVVATDGGYTSYRIEEEELAKAGALLVVAPDGRTQDELKALCRDADGLLVRQGKMDADFIRSLDKCRVLVRYGVGVDNVDIPACTVKKIVVCNVTDYCMEDVATHALSLVLACVRHIPRRDQLVRQGGWNFDAVAPSHRMSGRTLGLLGLGAIARQLARMVSGFGLEIIAYDPMVSAVLADQAGVELVDLDELFSRSDYLSLHAPLMDSTRKIVNQQTLSLMKPEAILVNTSRGGLVDDDALVDALKSARIAGAGLDVHNHEPLPAGSPYRSLPNVVLTDHAAWYSEESTRDLKRKVAAEAARVLAGERPRSPLNPGVLDVVKSSSSASIRRLKESQ